MANAATRLRMVQVIWIVPLINIGLCLVEYYQEEVTACMTACLGGTEVGGIRLYVEDHV